MVPTGHQLGHTDLGAFVWLEGDSPLPQRDNRAPALGPEAPHLTISPLQLWHEAEPGLLA